MKGVFFSDRAQHAGDDGLARGHAERAGHEAEILRRRDDLLAFQQALADEHGVFELGLGLGILEAIGIAPAVAELQRILRHGRHGHALEHAAVEEDAPGAAARPSHVVVGAGHHELVGLEVLVEDHLPGLRALDPEVLRNFALRRQEVANLGADDVVDPVHLGLQLHRCPDRAAKGAKQYGPV